MADKTKIEWTDASWTPIRARLTNRDAAINKPVGSVGWYCEHVSEGCRNCYSEGMNKRLGTGLDFKPGHRKDIELFLDEKMLTQPFRWRTTRRIFVCSMTDLFADFITDEWLDQIFDVMESGGADYIRGIWIKRPWHTFQILTKRPERMRQYLTARYAKKADYAAKFDQCPTPEMRDSPAARAALARAKPSYWSNIWLGCSCEDQGAANARIPHLKETPAAVRFISFEPLLGTIDVPLLLPGIDWAIIGGESGHGARPNWTPNVRKLVKQCRRANVAVFVKQMGANVQDRNDAGFEGCSPQEWPDIDPANVEHDVNGYSEEYQGAACRIRLKARKGGDMDEWPEDLRVREYPTVQE